MTSPIGVLNRLRELCAIPSYHAPSEGVDEKCIALHIEHLLRGCDWLHVQNCEVESGIHYVFAHDGQPDEIELLIAGHIDTVAPSVGWTSGLQGTIKDGNYYDLGANDTKSGIAATLEALLHIGPTSRVGYLFYGDEEYAFKGMNAFLRDWPQVSPKYAISLCGGPHGKAMTECRGCLEIAFTISGKSAHASRPHEGSNAIDAMNFVLSGLREWCDAHNTSAIVRSTFNAAGILGGSNIKKTESNATDPISVRFIPNKVPDAAWAVIDVRPGTPPITQEMLLKKAHELLNTFNEGKNHRAVFADVNVHFDRGSYCSSEQEIAFIYDIFHDVHQGNKKSAEAFGYIDIAALANTKGTALLCLSPLGNNPHAADEFTNIQSMEQYELCVRTLLSHYKR